MREKIRSYEVGDCEICFRSYENDEISYENVLPAEFIFTTVDDRRIKVCGEACIDWLEIASPEEIEQFL